VTTNLAEMNVPADLLRAILGHAQTGALAHYEHGKFAMQKRAALERWGQKLRQIVENKKAKVVAFA